MKMCKNNWMKRIIAVSVAAGMLLNTTLPSLAESGTEGGYESQNAADDNSTVNDSLTDAGQLGDETDNTNNTEAENETTEDQTDSAESIETETQTADTIDGQTEDTESTETENQTEITEEETEKQEIQLVLELLAEGTDDDSRASGLSLTEAIRLSNDLALDEKNNKIINVTDGTGLILLSNVRPADYCSGYTINLITTVGWDVTKSIEIQGKTYEFLGLGDETNPYSGTFTLDKSTSASQYSITTSRALFNSLSTDAALSNTIPFIISSESSSEKPLLAEKLKKGSSDNKLTCKSVLREPNEGVSDAKIGGLIGTMETDTNADISFENTVNSALTVKGESHTGLFCNTMESGASLTATFTNTNNGKITVEAAANGADAGGFVGHMEDGTLTIAGKSVAQVNSAYGNAGGLVGSANGGAIQIKEEENTNTYFIFADSFALKAGSDKAAGGLIGEYTVVGSETQTGKSSAEYDLSRYQFPAEGKEITISGGKNVGGVFGLLQNTSKNASVTLSKNPTNGINVKVSGAVTNFGGLIGSYQAENLAGSLAIKGEGDPFIHVVSAGGSKAGSSYGGVIGEVSEKSYVEIENVSVSTADMNSSANTRFGGLVGTVNDGLLNVGNVTLTTNGSDIAVNSVDGRGGLVGYLVKGVLRLHGKTDLSGQKITTAYNHVGQIVGNNGNGLVYATGIGNSLAADGTGWSLTRYSGTDRSGSDIGNWGGVVRLGENLTEGTDGAFTFDTAAHTVTVNNGTGAAKSNTNDFVAYALAFDLSNTYKDKNSALRFNNTVDPSASQSVILTGNVDLTGTGVIGIGKDNTEKGASAQTFTGTFDGGSYTVTLDIGTTYGAGISGSDNAAGQLYAKRSDQQDTHYSLALIPFAKNVTVQNLTIKGNVHCKIPKTVNQEGNETDVRYPAFASGVIGYASGDATFDKVTVNAAVSVTEETDANKLHAWQSGFLGRFEGTHLTYQNCIWGTDASLVEERSTDNARMGGLAAEVMGDAVVTVKDCTLSGTITSNAPSNARVGGLIAVSRGETQNGGNLSTISISNLLVNGEKVSAENANVTSGGLLGYQWQNTNVVFASADSTGSSTGVTISGASLTSSKAQFGGLVYQATGYWNASAKGSIVFSADTDNQATAFNGKSEEAAPSGLLVGTGLIRKTVKENNTEKDVVDSALYLEVGTWGSASDAAYQINSNAVTLNISNSEYFDELVGITKDSDFGNTNAVVSLAVRDSNGDAVRIDTNTITTYKGQIQNYTNGQTRYYYNLDSYRKKNSDLNLDSVSTAENLVLWSAAQYAAPNIRECFRKGDRTDVTISGNINLTGYSYYPVTPIGAVNLGTGTADTGLTFDYEGIETTETPNKQPSDSDHQHYLMHYGLFYNISHNIAVKKTSFSGTVGKESSADNTENSNVYNSGVLIFGSVEGDPANNIVEISLNNVTLAGIRVTGVQKENPAYAPLLINRIEQAAKLTVDTLTTGEGYRSGDGAEKTTVYAATSLIGHVGSNTATKLTLSFANIALDGRLHADTGNTTSVYNNGSVSVEYHTTHTIFTRATLLEAFQYSSNGSGTYNFNSTDTLVTYGVELTNTGSTGRNPDKQYQYYDCDSYITDEQNKSANEAYVKERYADSNFIRYVSVQQNITESRYELDINQKTTGLLKGCGTYGDPYIIEDAYQLSSLAAYINGGSTKFQAVFNSKVLEEQKQTADSYHTQDSATEDSMAGTDILYTWENGTWKRDAEDAKTIEKDKATKYLLNAYYKINRDITVSAESFAGLGTLTNPFSGVIVGNTQEVTVSVSGTNSNKDSFGGLIAYSRGSVVKDLKVDYSKAAITMQADSLPGTVKNPFFGGVVGYCMGGDTIIDHVSVSYGSNSVSFHGEYEYMIAAGGYAGLVGGATHIAEKSDYEKTGGGVVFRNMNGTTNSFSTTCSDANAANKTVNMKDVDANNKAGKSTSAGGDYFYRNPYVGRVLDGYACAEDCTVNNTDKNYTIPNLTAGTNDLQVSDASRSLNVTVTSAQGLWLLSAIVNSGAGAMDANGNYTDVDGQVVDAYQSGKPRTASYEGIGTASADDKNLVDEAYWGGWASTAGSDTAKNRVSYLVKNYTTGNAVARLAGKSTSTDTNTPVMLTFETDSIDMSSYGNGFRGIGSSYGNNKHVWNNDCSIPEVYRRNLLIQSINTDRTEDTVITLNMNQNDYHTEYSTGVWRNQGAGLFVDFHFTNGCEVNHLQISGNIKLGLFGAYSKLTYVTKRTNPEVHIGVGGFAARTANSSGTVTFNHFNLKDINVYGGTMTGGAIGYIDGYSGAGRNVSFTNWTIQNEKVTKWVYDDGSTGGLVGWNIGYGTLSITGNEDSSVKDVDQLSVTTHAESFNTAAAGGLVGANDYSSVKVENVNAQNLSVSGKNLRDLGGLLAAGRKGGMLEVKKCSLASMKITLEINSSQRSLSACAGGIIGFHERPLTISEVMIVSDSTINGQQFTGGFVGYSAVDVTIRDCREENINIKTAMNWIGGFIGYVNPNRTATFQNCLEENVNILGRYTGGLVGAVDGSITASNMTLERVMVITNGNASSYYAGLLTGNSANNGKSTNKVLGYNILAKDCKAGYSNVSDFNKLAAATIQSSDTTGLWLGNNGKTTKTNLTAVSAGGDVFPQKDIGTQSGVATIIYADKTADQTYRPTESTAKPSPSEAPWVDVNPKGDVPFADGTVMTGNGIGMSTDVPVAKSILQRFSSTDADRYWNLTESDNATDVTYRRFSQFLDTSNEAYITTYKTEESSTTEISADIDFPVLVVNNSAEVDTMLWNYIAAMTNVESGTKAKTQVKSITATTYKWDSKANNFAAQTTGSLNVSTTKKISIVPNAYDNMSSQFTLLDVTYVNPTNGEAEPFHLYIPVLVKKVLYIWFKTRFIAGTDYCASDYPMDDDKTNHYATAGFDEPLTAYIEYTYDQDTDWQSMLDNGENLLWSYDKILDLAYNSTGTLPKGTQLTLVDRQTKQYYTYTMNGNEDVNNFNLSQMQTPDGKSFTPADICDLLGLTVSDPMTDETDGAAYYVRETDKKNATVRVGTEYFRKATEADINEPKYRITAAGNREARIEGYYLTVQIPATTGVAMVNNRLNYAPLSRKEGTLPASVKTKTVNGVSTSSSGYPIYQGVEQTLTVSTSRIHNGSDMGSDTVMENGDSIKITLKGSLKLTDAGKDQFRKVGPAEVYHQFDINLKKYLAGNSEEYTVIGTEMVDYTYTLSGNGFSKTISGRLQNVASQETLTLHYGGSDLKKALEVADADSDETAVIVTAEITLTYATADNFPQRKTSNNNDNSGISVVGTSRIANTESQLPITRNKATKEHENRYYVANQSKATLNYSATDGSGVGDTTQQLGINPWDTSVNRSDIIYTRADYDYSGVDTEVLTNAKSIKYTMELFQKNENGTYDETNPLVIGSYLEDISKTNGGKAVSSGEKSKQWTEEFSPNDTKHEFAQIRFAPLTGTEFESAGYTYSNYKVRLTAVLLNESGTEIDGTKASDYIIYTNARICQEILVMGNDGSKTETR